jgi:predicted dehydrogenase
MLKGGIIGFGRMGLTHFSILNTHPNVALVAVCDSSGFILKNASRYLGIETFKDPQQMIEKVEMDFVVVTTPTAHHADMVLLAIEKGLNVFVEKPFTLNPQQGQEILQLLENKVLVNQVGYVLRFNDVFMQAKKLLDNQVLGELLTFKIEMNGPTLLHDAKQSWRSRKSEGGGCLYDFASHSIDLINYLIGPPDKVVGTVFQSIHSFGVEDAISSTFLYESGTRGNLLVNWSDPSYRKPAYHFEVLGRKGKLIADLHAYKIFFRETPSFDGFTEGWNQRYVTDVFESVRFYLRGYEFTRQLDYFVDCVLEKHPNQICTFQHAFKTDMVIDYIRKSEEAKEVLNG